MSDSAPKRTIFRRLWSIIYTIAGLSSGAAIMYLSPLVDRVVKPGRPLANFAVETDGLNATFHNRYAGEGWWDFGDGTALEPATPDQSSVTHAYARPGSYNAKLFVRNFVGDEHERSVGVDVSVASATSMATPAIASVEAFSISADRSAPATFRIVAQTSGADRVLWDIGPDQPLDVETQSLAKQERLVTFATPGRHVVQITALGGDEAVRKSITVQVDAARADTLVARLRVTDQGSRSEKLQLKTSIAITLAKNVKSVAIDRHIDARTGYKFTDVKLGKLDPAFSNLKLTPSADGRSVHLTGTLTPTTVMLQAQTPPFVPVQMTQERPVPTHSKPTEVTASISLPGSTVLPLPAVPPGTQPRRSMVLELRGPTGAGRELEVPVKNSLIDFAGRRYAVSAIAGEREVRLEVTPVTAGLTSREK